MRRALRVINVVFGILVILSAVMGGQDNPNGIIGTSPIFLGDLILLLLFCQLPIIVVFVWLNEAKRQNRPAIVMVIIAVACFYIAYTNLPHVMEKKLLPKLVAVEVGAEEVQAALNETPTEFLQQRLKELELFKGMYSAQYNYLRATDNSISTMSLVFGMTGVLLIINAIAYKPRTV